jgi:hypothetical protein
MNDKVRRFNHECHPNRAYNQSLMMPALDGQYIEASEVDGLVSASKRLDDAICGYARIDIGDTKRESAHRKEHAEALDLFRYQLARFAK